MINGLTHINPYTLIQPPPQGRIINRNSVKTRTFTQIKAENSLALLKAFSISTIGIPCKILEIYIENAGLIICDFQDLLKNLVSARKLSIGKDRYFITDRDLQKRLYSELGPKWRANYHNFYAHTLSDVYPGKPSLTPEIAFHFSKAGNIHQSKLYLEKAGDYLKETYKNNDAVKNYKKCISLLEDGELHHRLDIMIKILEILYTIGKWDEFNEMYSDAEDVSKKLGDKESRAKVLNLHGSVCFFRGEVDKAIKTFRKAENLMLGSINSFTYAETMRFLGRSFLQMGKNEKAHAFFTKTLTIGERLNNDELKAKALENIGRIHRLKSEYDTALEYYKKALPLYKKTGNSKGISNTLEKLGVISFYIGNNDEALRFFNKSNRVNSELNNSMAICNNLGNIGTIYFSKRNLVKAKVYYNKQYSLANEIGNKDIIAKSLGNIGLIYDEVGEYKNSLASYEKQLSIYKLINNYHGVSNSLSNVALINSYLGNLDLAIEITNMQIELDRKLKNNEGLARGYNNLGTYHLNKENYNSALRYLNSSIRICKHYNINKLIPGAYYNLSECFYYLKRYGKAKDYNKKSVSNLTSELEKKINLQKLKILSMLNQEDNEHIIQIESMILNSNSDEFNAEIYLVLFELTERHHYSYQAKKYYTTLFKKTNKYQYRLKLEKLAK